MSCLCCKSLIRYGYLLKYLSQSHWYKSAFQTVLFGFVGISDFKMTINPSSTICIETDFYHYQTVQNLIKKETRKKNQRRKEINRTRVGDGFFNWFKHGTFCSIQFMSLPCTFLWIYHKIQTRKWTDENFWTNQWECPLLVCHAQ